MKRAPRVSSTGLSSGETKSSNWTLHRISWVLLVSVFLFYVSFWLDANSGKLFDPQFQHDDARQHLFFYHRFDSGALRDDPVACELWRFSPPFFRLLYRALVPATGVLAASTIVQAVCYLILALCVLLLIRWQRGGLAVGLMAAFLLLHTNLVNRGVAGGLPKSFAFPLIMLWFSGALVSSRPARVVACLLSAAIYPSTMLLVLGSEVTLQALFLLRDPAGARRLKEAIGTVAFLGAGCAVIFLPHIISSSEAGRLPTYREAEQDPVLGPGGRVPIVPLRDPVAEVGYAAINPYQHFRESPGPLVRIGGAKATALLFMATFSLLILVRLSPFPTAAIALGVASVTVYFLSRILAFQLFLPGRYTSYGVAPASMALGITAIGLVGFRLADPGRATLRNLTASAFMLALCTFTGSGLVENSNMMKRGADLTELDGFALSLPVSARFASHPEDGDDLPLFAARATVIGSETLNPLLQKSYQRLRVRAEDVLLALYATDRREVLDFCRKYQVTHLLLRPERYQKNFLRKGAWVQPFSSLLRERALETSVEELVLRDPPAETIVFQNSTFRVVDVQLLARAWSH